MKQLIHSIAALHTCDDRDRVLHDASIVVEDGTVAAVCTGSPDGDFDRSIDMSGCIVLPGFVNLHHHFFQTLTRAIPATLSGHLIDWLGKMYPLWSGMTPDDVAAAATATMAELMLTGATTSVDHAYLMPGCDPAFTDGIVAAAGTAGMRLHLVRGSMTAMEGTLERDLAPRLGARAGGLVDDAPSVLADMERAVRKHHSPGHGAFVTLALGPTTATYGDFDFMTAVADLAGAYGCGLHTHFHPRPDERAACRALFGLPPIDVLARAGWLRPGTWFAHSTRLDAVDMRKIAAAGVAVAHCPRMILRLGARITPVHALREAGVPVGFGVDGGASNDSGSMLGEIRIGLLLHRLAGGEGAVPWQDWLSPRDALHMATRGAASILGRSDIGHLSVGACADVTGFDMRGIGFAGARTDLLAGLLLAGDDTRAALTMIGGRVRVLNGTLVAMDEGLARAAVDAATERLIARAHALTGIDYLQHRSRRRSDERLRHRKV